jgi:hypothetical protein
MGVVAAFVLLAAVMPSFSQEQQEMSAEDAAKMEAWTKAATPNENHQRLAERVGTWSFTSRWWSKPGEQPMESKGTSTFEMILGGRYLREKVKSEWMGQPFEGEGCTGYDNLKQAYVSTWVDNMGTGVMTSEGKWDAAAKTYTWQGEYMDAVTGQPKKIRMVEKIESPDKHTVEFFDKGPDGKEFKSMELVYTRQ